MIRFVKHQDIDPIAWNHAIEKALNGSVFASFEMLDALTGNSSWHAIIQDDYAAVLPLPYRRKFGISYLYTPFFLPKMGIFAENLVNPDESLMFFNAIPRRYLQIDLLFNKENNISDLPGNQLFLTSHEVDLQTSYNALLAGFSQNTRRNIKSAEKHFLTIEKNNKLIDEIINLFEQNRGKDRAVHYHPQDYLMLGRASEVLLQKGQLDVLGVRDASQKLIAGAFMVRDGKRIWFWFSGRDESAFECKPMFFLIHEYLKANCETRVVFDFNGSTNENVARFYRGFGAIPYPIPMIQYSRIAILGFLKKKLVNR